LLWIAISPPKTTGTADGAGGGFQFPWLLPAEWTDAWMNLRLLTCKIFRIQDSSREQGLRWNKILHFSIFFL
jgi:hypothetical protein